MSLDVSWEVDVIIVGGGAAGCILASRLAQADRNLEILLIEAGSDNKDIPIITTPALFPVNYSPDVGHVKFLMGKPTEHTQGRPIPVIVPSVLGGGGSVNMMTYARGLASDFDSWNTEGWMAKDLVPILKGLEAYPAVDGVVDKAAHGVDGEFAASHGGGFSKHKFWTDDFLQASEKSGLNVVADSQDLKTTNGVSAPACWVNAETGCRQDSSHILLHPLLKPAASKLKILTRHNVVRVLFDSSAKAKAVDTVSNDQGGQSLNIKARRLVIMCAGTINTPQILERSGVGDPELLSKLDIPVVSALPGVGTNYMDHHFTRAKYKSTAGPEYTLDGLWSQRTNAADLMVESPGIMGWNSGVLIGKIRPSLAELETMDVLFKDMYKQDYTSPERPLLLISGTASSIGPPLPPGQYVGFAFAVAYGRSRGYIHVSGKAITDKPDFDCGTLSHSGDLTTLTWGYKKTREVARRMKTYDGAFAPSHPVFSKDSDANLDTDDALIRSQGADKSNLTDIVYSEEDDKAIEDFVRQTAGTLWHYGGTCAMKPQEDGGVVRKDLSVYGVSGLKIADMSIVPSLVAGNTYSTALVIGEKAAQIISEELGLRI